MTKQTGPLLPLSAVACYQKTTGEYLGVVRLRLLEAFPLEVGRHAFETPTGRANVARPDLHWKPSPDIDPPLAAELERLFSRLAESDSPVSLLQSLLAGTPGETDFVFLECYPWERPRRLLNDALRALSFHGKAIRADLQSRLEVRDGQGEATAMPPLARVG